MAKPLKVKYGVSIPSDLLGVVDDVLFGNRKLLQQILSNQQDLKTSINQLKELVMSARDDVLAAVTAFATDIDAVTNTIGTNVQVVAQKIADLQAQIAAGNVTPADISAALDPIKSHLAAQSDALAAVASGGTTNVPPVEPL